MEAQPTSNIFTLPAVANSSSSSLMDAVVGGSKSTFAPPFTLASLREEGEGQPRKKEEVKELEAKLQKRRSLIPHLENELAELEAQIKAAEERLSRAAEATQQTAA